MERIAATLRGPRGLCLLEGASLAYVLAPVLLFVLGWVRPTLAWPMAVLAVVCALGRWRRVFEDTDGCPAPGVPVSNRRWLAHAAAVVLLALVFSALSGIGGYTFQHEDYMKHDAVLGDLIAYDWPLGYADVPLRDGPGMLVIYYAFYLPAAAVGKLLGWAAAYHFLFLWSALGVLLTLAWCARVAGTGRWWFALLFLVFGGLDVLGNLLVESVPDGADFTWRDRMLGAFPWWLHAYGYHDFWLANYALFHEDGSLGAAVLGWMSTFTRLVTVPHHVLPAWVVLGMLLHDGLCRRTTERAGFLWALLPYMSVFVALGAAPYVAWFVFRRRWRTCWTWANLLAGPLLLAAVFFFYQSNSGDFPKGWLWQFVPIHVLLPYLLLFYAFEFGPFLLLTPAAALNRELRPAFLLTAALLLAMPLFVIGGQNEWVLNGGTMAQLVLIVAVAQALSRGHAEGRWPRRRCALMACLVIGAGACAGQVYRALDYGFACAPPPRERARHVREAPNMEEAAKYFGTPDRFFWRYIAAAPNLARAEPMPPTVEWDFSGATQSEAWTFGDPQAAPTPGGVVARALPERPLLRLDGLNLDARRAGTVEIVLELDTPHEGGGWPEYALPLQFHWDTLGDTAGERRFRVIDLYKNVSPHTWAHIAAKNAYWRGTIADVWFTLDLPPLDGVYTTVRIKRVRLLPR